MKIRMTESQLESLQRRALNLMRSNQVGFLKMEKGKFELSDEIKGGVIAITKALLTENELDDFEQFKKTGWRKVCFLDYEIARNPRG